MEKVRKISKKYYFRQVMACWLVFLMFFGIPARVALATPNNGTFTVGTGIIVDNVTDSTVVVDQLQSVIEWGGLDTTSLESLAFSQGELSNSAVLNRVTSGLATQFDGALTATDMRIFIVNPAGLAFGPTAYVTARNFVGAAMNMTNENFLAATGVTPGNMNFSGSGNLLNEGRISAEVVYLVGENVINTGSIGNGEIPSEVVVLAAGDQVVIGQPGSDVFVKVTMDTGTDPADRVVDTSGLGIEADHVVLAAGDIWAAALDVQTLRAEAKRDVVIGDIYAYSDGGSDAVATVEIEAGRDVTVNDEIYAEAYQDSGNSEDNAFALIDVKAGRDIEFKDYGDGEYGDSDLGAYAYTEYGSGDATAVYNINAGRDVLLNARIKSKVESYDSGDATTQITITGRNITTNDRIISRIKNNGSGNSTGTIDIIARGNVVINGGDDEYDYGVNNKIESKSGAGNATANTTITGQNITITDAAVVSRAKTDDSGDATANVNVEAAGNLDITTTDGYYYGAWVKSHATTEDDSGDATAATTIKGVDITIVGYRSGGDDGSVIAKASADDSGSATANLNVDASGDILLKDEAYVGSEARVITDEGTIVDFIPEEQELIRNASATTMVDAGGDVTVEYGDIYAWAYTGYGSSGTVGNLTATVDVDAGGDVTTKYGDIYAYAYTSYDSSGTVGNLTATTTINAGGNVTVGDAEDGDGDWISSYIYADAEVSGGTAGNVTATTTVNAGDDVTVKYGCIYTYAMNYGTAGDVTAIVDVDAGGNVTVHDYSCCVAAWASDYSGFAGNLVTATTNIAACGNVIVDGLIGAYAEVSEEASTPDTAANVTIHAYGDVIVNSEDDDAGQIEAEAHGGVENSAGVTILSVGDVIVNDGSGIGTMGEQNDDREIIAEAYDGHINNAFIGIATRDGDDGDVIVSGQIGAHTWDAWGEGSQNTSIVEISAARDVIVNGGYALYGFLDNPGPILLESEEGGQILAEAYNEGSAINTAGVEIYAGRDVIVEGADVEYVEYVDFEGGEAADFDGGDDAYLGGQIVAEADSGWLNTANIGIVAGRDVTVNSATITGEVVNGYLDGFGENVGGQVLAQALYGEENTAEVDICAQDDVTIDGTIWAEAWYEEAAHIRIAAGDEVTGIGGVLVAGADSISILVTDESKVNLDEMAYVYPEPEIEEGSVDCPECDFEWIDWSWCEDCEEGEEDIFTESAPLPQTVIPGFEEVTFGLGGCPALMVWLADEFGVPEEDIQIFIANTFALSTDTQPCEVCARLKDAADILDDDAMTAALAQVVNEFITTPAPPSEEQMTLIATAFADHAGDGTYYASAGQWIDALAAYVSIMTDEMGFPAGDSVALLLDKHGLPEGTDATVVAYVQARLAALGG